MRQAHALPFSDVTCAILFGFVILVIGSLATAEARSISVNEFRVVDGDTIHLLSEDRATRLVGYNAPETTARPGVCPHELTVGPLATEYFEKLITPPAKLQLIIVPCSCSPKTIGTDRCNYGRSCARLLVDGRDVRDLMIKAGYGARFECSHTSCPKLPHPWCS